MEMTEKVTDTRCRVWVDGEEQPVAGQHEDPLANHPGLVWREKEVEGAVIQTMRGPMPTMAVERKPDLNLAALSKCAWAPGPVVVSGLTFREALRDLVAGIDVRGEDGSWSIDRDALDRAKKILGLSDYLAERKKREDHLDPLRRRITEVAGLPSAVLGLEKEGTL